MTQVHELINAQRAQGTWKLFLKKIEFLMLNQSFDLLDDVRERNFDLGNIIRKT